MWMGVNKIDCELIAIINTILLMIQTVCDYRIIELIVHSRVTD